MGLFVGCHLVVSKRLCLVHYAIVMLNIYCLVLLTTMKCLRSEQLGPLTCLCISTNHRLQPFIRQMVKYVDHTSSSHIIIRQLLQTPLLDGVR